MNNIPYITDNIVATFVIPRTDKKINCIKEVRIALGIGLKEAKDFVEHAQDTSITFICSAAQYAYMHALFNYIHADLGGQVQFVDLATDKTPYNFT